MQRIKKNFKGLNRLNKRFGTNIKVKNLGKSNEETPKAFNKRTGLFLTHNNQKVCVD